MPCYPLTNFEVQKYYKNNLNLMVFFSKIIYLKERMEHT